MVEGLNIKKVFILILLLTIIVQNTGCVGKKNEDPQTNNSTPSVVAHMHHGWGDDPCTFVLYPDNKLTISYGERDTLDFYNMDETGGMGEEADRYEKKVSRKDRKRIDEIVDSIKRDCITYEKLNYQEWSDARIIYCHIDGKVYCGFYVSAEGLSKYSENHQVVQLVHEFLKYAPVVKIDEDSIRYGDGSIMGIE